jgi:cell division ATPase FtsA
MGIFSHIFSSPQIKEELVLVFDVGSSSVGGALFWMQKSGIPKIIFSIRAPITLEETVDSERFLALTAKALEEVANKISTKGLGAPKKVFCVLSSPWYASQTRTIRLEKNTPFVFNSKLADSLIAKEISIFEEEHLKKYLEGGSKIIAIELKSMKTMLNGYPTAKPFNQKAKELEMVMFISMSGEQVLAKIKEAVCRHFGCESIKFSSFAIASFTVARDLFAHHSDFMLIDIGGEVTDISMVKKDILSGSASFPVGPNFFIRGVAAELKCSLTEAKSLISLYKDGHAGGEAEAKLVPVIAKLRNEWLKKFEECLVSLSNDISIPSIIFVTVDQELAEFFLDTIKSEQLNQYTLTESKFQVNLLGTEVLHGAAEIQETGNALRDPFLIIEAIYINRFLATI